MLGNNMLRDWLVLTVDNIHVKFPFTSFDDCTKLGWILNAIVECFEEDTATNKSVIKNILF
jgi:hypothetical protein